MTAHASHRMHEHSLATYREASALISGRRGEVYRWIESNGPATDRGVMVGLGYRDMNAVRPRITELIAAGILIETGSTRCPVTGKPVRLVDKPNRIAQMPLL